MNQRPKRARQGEQSAPLPARRAALAKLVELVGNWADPKALDFAKAVLTRAARRLQLSADHTVTALAGTTGSGKSSLFNALAGLELAQVGVRRPTTTTALACAWDVNAANPLLDWLDIPAPCRLAAHRTSDAMPSEATSLKDLSGLILLDLPDHDSIHFAHRREVDRLVNLADLLVWVLDPQKYGDATVHERYLRPLAGHAQVMVVVLNHIDQLTDSAAGECLADLRRLLAADGLADLPILPTSTRTGQGLAQLRSLLTERVTHRRALADRISADVDRAVARLATYTEPDNAKLSSRQRRELLKALRGAAGSSSTPSRR